MSQEVSTFAREKRKLEHHIQNGKKVIVRDKR